MDTEVRTAREMTLEEMANRGREDIKPIELFVRAMQKNSAFREEQAWAGQHEELKAQIDLAVRHLEDARMRLGKVIQYLGGDQASVYDR